ncbi:MAG: filamentous hemagglutinin N-terminal domain-containing protein, partial [Verrucomicrobiota bacterium]|nr:filamentous hemagglutinin N-terminal domain-containing protein [Verrucomicrobiota bacterium]
MNYRPKFIIFVLLLCLFSHAWRGLGQVVVDNSFGSAGVLSGPNFKIPDALGKTVEGNLFHSFSEFSLQTGQSATFTGPDSIQNILGRVTGGKVSEIDGLIQSEISDANLYLLNPNGFLFGKNAKVDVDGSFTVSTRESLKLGGDGSFNAVNPDQSVFTSAAPDAFGFLGDNPGGAIRFSGSKLIVGNPVGLVGGDIKLEDSVIYSRSGGKPTGVNIEGDNLIIVDSQIRNKSTVEVEGVQQGIEIDLKGDIRITDTTITEADGSGVDRGDFIDEIGSDVPFASKVGILGVNEGIKNSDSIAINAKVIKITGGGLYSVNDVKDDNIMGTTSSSDIQINTGSLHMYRGELQHKAVYDNVMHINTVTAKRTTNSINTGRFPFKEIGNIELYLNGTRVFELKDFNFRSNSRGTIVGVDFYEKISKGDEVKIVSMPVLSFKETKLALDVEAEMSMENLSLLKSDAIILNSGDLLMDESNINANKLARINVSKFISLGAGSGIKSNYIENGSLDIISGDLEINESNIEGSKSIKIRTDNKSIIKNKSTISVGWETTEVAFDDRVKVYWDAVTGDIIDQFGMLYPSKFNNASSALSYLSRLYGVDKSTINMIDIYRPYNIRSIPSIDITSGQIVVEHGIFDSRAFGKPSGLKLNSKQDIHLSGQSRVNRFSLLEFKSKSVKIDSGFKFNSSSDSNIPIEILNIKSQGDVDLNGVTLEASLVVDSDSSVALTDSTVNGSIVRLDAKDDLLIDQGELGITPYFTAQRVSLLGGNISVGSVGVESKVDVRINASRKIEIDGPTRIGAWLRGVQSIAIEAPEIYLNEGTEIDASVAEVAWGQSGSIYIVGSRKLNLKGAIFKFNGSQLFSETPSIELRGGDIALDNSKLLHFSFYNDDSHGEKYAKQHRNLSGSKMTKINATKSVKFSNASYIYTNNGDVQIKASDIDLTDTKIVSLNTWPVSQRAPSLVELDARRSIALSNTTILGQSLSNFKRMKINLRGYRMNSRNTFVGIVDERKGTSGSIDLDFRSSIDLDKTQIASIGLDYLKTRTNGNNINVKSKDLAMKDSVITGIVQGDGKTGVTKLSVTGEISLDKSFIGGMLKPIKSVVLKDFITDGTIGQSKNLGNGKIVNIPSTYGEIHGSNLYHSFRSFDLGSAQKIVFDIPEGVENVFVRITGDDSTALNGEITSNSKGGDITILNKNGFELGPDMKFHTFSGIRVGAVDSIVFDDGTKFEVRGIIGENLSEGKAIYQFDSERLTGSIKLLGASVRHYDSGNTGQTDISLLGDALDMAASVVTTTDGADINIIGNSLGMINLSSLDAISPKGGDGGDINVKVNNISLDQSGMRTVSVGGIGGDVNIDANNIKTKDMLMSRIAADNYYLDSVRKNYKTGNINITAKDTFENERLLIAISSYTPGGAGNIKINAGKFFGSGPDWTASSEFWINAYQGKTGEISINVDTFDAELVRIQNYAFSDQNLKLNEAEKAGYGDVTINAKDINFGRFLAYTGTQKNRGLASAADIHFNAENDISINEIWLAPVGGMRTGVGGDITFKAKNIISTQDALNFDPVYHPTIYNPGQVRFYVEDKLELGVMNFLNGNSSPIREMIYEFKATDIVFGMQIGDEGLSKSSVKFNHLNYSNKDHRTIISASGDVRFLSGVDLKNPALSLEAMNFDMSNSQIGVHATFDSDLIVHDALTLRNGSFIESITGVRPKGGKPVSLNISSEKLEMTDKSYISSANHEWFDGGGANPNINLMTYTILMKDSSFITTKSTNRDNAGELSVSAHQLSMQKESKIGSYNFSTGETGGVAIDATKIEMVEGASIGNGFDYALLDNNNLFPFVSADSAGIKISSEILNLEGG